MSPPVGRSGLTSSKKPGPSSAYQPRPLMSGMTTMLPDEPSSKGTAPKPRPSGYIPVPSSNPKIITADMEKISRSSSKERHAPSFSGQGRPAMTPSINKIPQAVSSFQQPPTTVPLGPFSGLSAGKKTVNFPEILEESIPELPNASDLPLPKLKDGKQRSIAVSTLSRHLLKGGEKSSPPEHRDKDHPKASLENATKPKFKSEDADEANGETTSHAESPSGLKSPPSVSRSRVPSPETITVDQKPSLEPEPRSKSDDAEEFDAHPSTPSGSESGSKGPPPNPHTTAPSPRVIYVGPGPSIRQETGSLSHTGKHRQPRAPSTLKSFSGANPRSRMSSFSAAGHTQPGKPYNC
ncbi:hypothetical protein CORC01_01526 [Colletotrichum orchidophilum]|uniref:Uncharacterized protein n=1 Tax=Colletotrichum orchidophilum TaxID=1209926 RepID=A0A1G4BNW4_9PEZI|nr:uncharacterized protein CORC01_01526 [Colletotrichum orchidophilum]OHF03142.1 hypothetical protein CORC01_01526 [Colletotrichum orchidophilum]